MAFGDTGRAGRVVCGAVCLAMACGVGSAGAGEIIYGVTARSQLVTFDSSSPGLLLSAHFISGLGPSEEIINIDFRPSTGDLYALGSLNRVYRINPATAAASLVGTGFSPLLNGIEFGFDFNPVADRIRVVSDMEQNLRLHPDTGAAAAVDVNLAYAPGDPNFGANPNVVGAAYTNNFAGATTTTLYGIDSSLDILVTVNPPNNGQLNTVGALGFNTSGLVGFDISGGTGIAYASMHTPGDHVTRLFTINLATGAAAPVGIIGVGTDPILIRDIAVVPTPGGVALLGLGLAAACRRRRA